MHVSEPQNTVQAHCRTHDSLEEYRNAFRDHTKCPRNVEIFLLKMQGTASR